MIALLVVTLIITLMITCMITLMITCRYDEDEAKSNRDNQEASRSALQRYLFYCNRWVQVQV